MSVVSRSSCKSPTTTSSARLQFSLRSLLVMCAWCSFVLGLLVNAMPSSYRFAAACIVAFPILVAWKGAKYKLSLLGGTGVGISLGIISFLSLCAVGQLEPYWIHLTSSVTIGFVSGVVGLFIAPNFGSDDEPGRPALVGNGVIFRRAALSVVTFSMVLLTIFLVARGYNAAYQSAHRFHCSQLESQGVIVKYRPAEIPTWLRRLLGTNTNVAGHVEFFEPITPKSAHSLSELQTVTSISLIGSEMDNDSLSRIPESPHLIDMSLGDTLITDDGLELLQRWPRLRTLALNKTPIGDDAISHIASLRSLQSLQILSTSFSDEGIKKLREFLPASCTLTSGEWPEPQVDGL